jgi:hypothetical protein
MDLSFCSLPIWSLIVYPHFGARESHCIKGSSNFVLLIASHCTHSLKVQLDRLPFGRLQSRHNLISTFALFPIWCTSACLIS